MDAATIPVHGGFVRSAQSAVEAQRRCHTKVGDVGSTALQAGEILILERMKTCRSPSVQCVLLRRHPFQRDGRQTILQVFVAVIDGSAVFLLAH